MSVIRNIVLDGEHDSVGLLDGLCDVVVFALIPDHEHTGDDAALLIALTRCTSEGDITLLDLPDDPRAAGQARQHVREQLAVWGLEDLAMTTELAVSELVGNVVRHGKASMRLRLLRSQSLICEVYDGSLSTPRIRRAAFTIREAVACTWCPSSVAAGAPATSRMASASGPSRASPPEPRLAPAVTEHDRCPAVCPFRLTHRPDPARRAAAPRDAVRRAVQARGLVE
jgi:hypothetical protein